MLWFVAVPPLAWCIVAALLDWTGHRERLPTQADVLVVPGCAVRHDGSPSSALRRRTLRAVALWKAEHAPLLLVTGGVGKFPPSEAEVAASVAMEAGVPNRAILLESNSTSTEENARFAAQLLPNPRNLSIVVVTDGYHTWRCKRLFGRHFGTVYAAGSRPSKQLRVRGAIREVASILLMAARSALNGMR
tara:strand:- start:1079 stop:1648 length:570 start_codon:yes stop_codon:yes gene_type:complete